MPRRIARALPLALLFGLSGCAHVISDNVRADIRKDLTFQMVLADPEAFAGATVAWGGVIVETRNHRGGTDLVILETPLEYGDVPADPDSYEGRFIARTSRFLDPAIYAKGRKITVAGKIAGKETRPLGETEYTYPLLEIRQSYLWPPPQPAYYWPYPPYRAYPPWPWWDDRWCAWPGCPWP